jgi:hypothetical protein
MAKRKMLDAVANWEPDSEDPYGDDKRALLEFLLDNAVGAANPISIARVAKEAGFAKKYSREGVQQQLMVPLRAEGIMFIGTGNKGIYLIDSPEDGDNTILKSLAARYKLFSGYTSGRRKGPKGFLYFDESGTPSLNDTATVPYFIVCGIFLEGSSALKSIDKRFELIAQILGKAPNYEFKSTALDKKQYTKVSVCVSVLGRRTVKPGVGFGAVLR